MSRPGDFPYVMLGSWLDRDAADRMLAGRTEPDDAPPGFVGVARLVGTLNAAPADRELEHERSAVAAAVRVLHEPAPIPAQARRWRMRSKLSRTKVAGLVVVGTLVGTTGMAAANVLPDPAQDAVSNALSHVGITVPATTDTTDSSSLDATTLEHPAATGEEISQLARTTDATGVDKGAEISTTASGGMSRAGTQGGPTAETAGGGGAGAADHASGGGDEAGSSRADRASGGRSDQGAGNAPGSPHS